jgi:hypothetical protein
MTTHSGRSSLAARKPSHDGGTVDCRDGKMPKPPRRAQKDYVSLPSPSHTDPQTDYLVEALVNMWDQPGLWS